MGVGGGFVATEPGGERIVAGREAGCGGSPFTTEVPVQGGQPRRSYSVLKLEVRRRWAALGQRPSSFLVELARR